VKQIGLKNQMYKFLQNMQYTSKKACSESVTTAFLEATPFFIVSVVHQGVLETEVSSCSEDLQSNRRAAL